MTRLMFTIPQIDAPTRQAPAVPVDVHRAQDFAIVSRSVTGQDLSLAPGDYVAVVRFPNGREASQTFHLDAETTAVELLDVAKAIGEEATADPVEGVEWTSPLSYDFIDFNPFSNDLAVLHQGRPFQGKKEVRGPSGDRWRYLAVAPEGSAVQDTPSAGKTYLIAIPAPEEAHITVTVNLDRGHRPRPTFVMPRVAATMLYRYISQGASESAARLSGSAELCALELVANKSEDPISGALGMYLLLNTNRLDKIGERSEKLFRYNSRLADGAVIWAEHLARMGRHEHAADVLTSLKERGIPALTVGFRMALSRISTYIAAGLAKDALPEIDRVLRYWAGRAVPSSPTSVIELDPMWSKRVRGKLAAQKLEAQR